MSSSFEQLSETVVHEGAIITLVDATFSAPDGSTISRDIVRHPGAVGVVAVDGDEVILVRQFRAAAGIEILEIPAGRRDVAGEAPEQTARRELIEEVGYEAGMLAPLARFFNSVGFCDEFSYVFLATELSPATATPIGVEEEHMTIERMALADIDSAIADGRIIDSKTIVGLSLALRRLGR